MAILEQATVRNRLFAGLSVADRELLQPHLTPVRLDLNELVLRAGDPIEHVTFVEQGVVSTLANAAAGRVEVGMVGREGLVGLPVVHGIDRDAHD
jgi:CRP-like cAMP-binding protein